MRTTLVSGATRAIIQQQSTPSRSSFTCMMSSTVKQAVHFSANADVEALSARLEPLVSHDQGTRRWVLTAPGTGVERTFKFKTFKKTWEFMNSVAAECAVQKHHPEWSNVYNTTFIRWTTHSPPGLSEKDISMAAFCDEQAALHGEVESTGDGVGKQLADKVALEGGDCCVPKRKIL